jgi:hypothetical protein
VIAPASLIPVRSFRGRPGLGFEEEVSSNHVFDTDSSFVAFVLSRRRFRYLKNPSITSTHRHRGPFFSEGRFQDFVFWLFPTFAVPLSTLARTNRARDIICSKFLPRHNCIHIVPNQVTYGFEYLPIIHELLYQCPAIYTVKFSPKPNAYSKAE